MMQTIYPKKLQLGDKIMIVAPSRSFSILSSDVSVEEIAKKRLEQLGFQVVFGNHITECNEFLTSSVESRIKDIHTAFADTTISGILTVIGGYSTNQILEYLDYNLIKNNPKIVCGFSDITMLHNAILAKTGMICYYGPHYSSRRMKYGFDYSMEYFRKCCIESDSFDIIPSDQWSDDERYLDQEKRTFEQNEGYVILQEGIGKGKIIGGNLETLSALMGTPYFPHIDEDCILFIEQDAEMGTPQRFDRRLEQLLQADFSSYFKGIMIGRFQKRNTVSIEQLKIIITSKKKLKNIPIVANIDFGHTTPMATFPIGGLGKVLAYDNKVNISILKH